MVGFNGTSFFSGYSFFFSWFEGTSKGGSPKNGVPVLSSLNSVNCDRFQPLRETQLSSFLGGGNQDGREQVWVEVLRCPWDETEK